MKREKVYPVLVILIVLFAALLSASPAVAVEACPLPTAIYWLPVTGNDANNGALATPVLTLDRAERLAAVGGGCIYLVQNPEPVRVRVVQAQTSNTGVPLAQAVLYGLLMLLAVTLVAVGLWARRKAQNQPSYQPQA